MREVQVGDRLEWVYRNPPARASIIEWTGDGWLVIEGPSSGELYSNSRSTLNSHRLWKFIGNFGKDNNFNVLYDLMNS